MPGTAPFATAVTGRDAGRVLARHHLLLVPAGTRERAVAALVLARHPDAATHPGGGLRLGRHAVLTGPLVLDAAAAAGAAVPAPWDLAWALECPREREGPPLPGLGDRDGLTRAFPGGLPVRAEGRAVETVLGVARRLGGALRAAGSGAVLVPDPWAWPEVDVHAPTRLAPGQALALLAPVCPGLALAGGDGAWAGVRPEAMEHLAGLEPAISPAERDRWHAALDARDAAAVALRSTGPAGPAGPDPAEAYALAVHLTGPRGGDGGVVEVLVDQVDREPAPAPPAPAPPAPAPPAPAPPAPAGPSTYRVRWWPPDQAAAEQEVPSAVHVELRSRALAVIDALAGALVHGLGGRAVDAGGFPLGPAR